MNSCSRRLTRVRSQCWSCLPLQDLTAMSRNAEWVLQLHYTPERLNATKVHLCYSALSAGLLKVCSNSSKKLAIMIRKSLKSIRREGVTWAKFRLRCHLPNPVYYFRPVIDTSRLTSSPKKRFAKLLQFLRGNCFENVWPYFSLVPLFKCNPPSFIIVSNKNATPLSSPPPPNLLIGSLPRTSIKGRQIHRILLSHSKRKYSQSHTVRLNRGFTVTAGGTYPICFP